MSLRLDGSNPFSPQALLALVSTFKRLFTYQHSRNVRTNGAVGWSRSHNCRNSSEFCSTNLSQISSMIKGKFFSGAWICLSLRCLNRLAVQDAIDLAQRSDCVHSFQVSLAVNTARHACLMRLPFNQTQKDRGQSSPLKRTEIVSKSGWPDSGQYLELRWANWKLKSSPNQLKITAKCLTFPCERRSAAEWADLHLRPVSTHKVTKV